MSLKYEPASEPLHVLDHQRAFTGDSCDGEDGEVRIDFALRQQFYAEVAEVNNNAIW